MNWEEVIDVISVVVKEADSRRQIYERLLDVCTYEDQDVIQAFGIDKLFDQVAKDYVEEDLYEEMEDDGYDYDEE